MLKRYLTLFFFISLFVVNRLTAQELRYRSDIITRENGLSNITVTSILKDKYGFLWFGTWNGLNRYDGYEMNVFRSYPTDSTTISNSNVNSIMEDHDGFLWIATNNGLNCYDQKTGRFRRYYFNLVEGKEPRNMQVNSIVEDNEGYIWSGCQEAGLIRLDKKTGEFVQYFIGEKENSGVIFSLLQDNHDHTKIWVGTSNGLYCFNKEDRSFSMIKKGLSNPNVSVLKMLQDQKGNIYAGTWGNGLLCYEYRTSNLITCDIRDSKGLSVKNSIIRAMAFDYQGNIIICIRDRGPMVYNPVNGKAEILYTGPMDISLTDKFITSIVVEPSGILWMGTIYDGVIKVVNLVNSFKYYNTNDKIQGTRNGGGITAILEDSDDNLWLGTRFGGLAKIDRKTNRIALYTSSPGGLSSNNILSLLEIKDGNRKKIWIGTDGGGLNCLDPASGKFKVYRKKESDITDLASSSISTIIRYDADHLIIGTRDRNLGDGCIIFNMTTGKSVNLRYDPNDSTSLSSNYILKLFMDRTGKVWVGTRNGGLNQFVIKNINADNPKDLGFFIRYTYNPEDPNSLINNTISSIQDDAKNNLWLGTNDGGLTRFDPKTVTFQSSHVYRYLDDNLIYGILADDQDNLWISSSKGIMVLDLSNNDVHSFDKFDGLQETSFIYGSYFKSSSGEMFFGGMNGCNSFYPDSIKVNLKVPDIVITSLQVAGKKGTVKISDITGKTVLFSKSLQVLHYQNNFSIAFSALDFQMPEKNRFKYQLVGYDDDWIETTASRRYVNYTNLPPGKYIFKVIGSNSDDIWNHTGTSINITIVPPFWKTNWFLAGLCLVLIEILFLLIKWISKKYQHEKDMAAREALSSLNDERKQLRTLIDNIPDLIFIKDKESRFTVANNKVASIMHTNSENLIGKTDFEFYAKSLAQKFYEDEQKIITTGIPLINHEEISLDENGNRVIRSTTKVPVRNSDGEIIGIVGVCRDITKLKQIENQLRKKSEDLQETNRLLETRQKEIMIQSEELAEQTQNLLMINAELDLLNKTKDKFFSIIAHDLRNPFNAIIGFCELLRNDFNEMDNDQKLNVLELINVSSQTAYNLLENLLQWARTQTNKINFNPEEFDLSEMTKSVMDLYGIMAGRKGLKMKNEVPCNTLVNADKNMINTVLRNLVSNAIKFSNPEGEVAIHVLKKGDRVEVSVTDDGVGMNRDSLSKLFRIDTYYSTSGTMGETGTGLGLIICKEFIEKNNGRIRAESNPGSGTAVIFTLNATCN